MQGSLGLAYINNGDNVLHPGKVVEAIDPNHIVVETQEGKTYQGQFVATAYSPPQAFMRSDTYFPTSKFIVGATNSETIYPGPAPAPSLPIPPHLPITAAEDGLVRFPQDNPFAYYIIFRFAKAAHPTKVTFAWFGSPMEIPFQSDFPSLSAGLPAKSASDLVDALRQRNSNLQLDAPTCNKATLSFHASNINQLDEEHLDISYGIWYPNGRYYLFRDNANIFRVGPGQTTQIQQGLPGENGIPKYLLLYSPDLEHADLYDLACP
jgi:hypothetical protein